MAFSEEVYNYAASRELSIHGWAYTHFHTTSFIDSGGALAAKNYFLANAKSNNLSRYYNRQKKRYSDLNNLSYIDEMFSNNNLAIFEQAVVASLQESINRVASGTENLGDDFSRIRANYKNLFNQGLPSFKRMINFLIKTSQILSQMSHQGSAVLLELAQQLKNNGLQNYNLVNLSRQINQAISSLNNSGIINYDTQLVINLLAELNQVIQQVQTDGKMASSKFSNSLKQMFNTGLGEGLVGMAVADLGNQAENDIIEYLVGRDTRLSYSGIKKVQIKPDSYGNYLVPLSNNNGQTVYNIKLPIAPSVKFYSSRGLKHLGGYGIHEGNIYSLILKTAAPKMAHNRSMSYLVFNSIASSEDESLVLPLSYFVLKNLGVEILTGSGQISSSGIQDQANVLVANGKVYSMGDIMRKIDALTYSQMSDEIFNLKFKGARVKGAWVAGEGITPAYNRAKRASKAMFGFQVRMNFHPEELLK